MKENVRFVMEMNLKDLTLIDVSIAMILKEEELQIVITVNQMEKNLNAMNANLVIYYCQTIIHA